MNVVPTKLLCVVCGIEASQMCQRCGETYCDSVCQRKDWQQHKYVCTIMPPLVSVNSANPISSLKAKPDGSNKVTNMGEKTSDLSPLLKNVKIRESCQSDWGTAWRKCSMLPGKEFDCHVTHIEKDGHIWVVDLRNIESLSRLTMVITSNLMHQKPCSIEDLSLGKLVGVIMEKKGYRAEVISLNVSTEHVEVRLIDHGAVSGYNVKDVYLPIQCMAEENAYAFKVKLPNNVIVQINKKLSLRRMDIKTTDGIEQVQLAFKVGIHDLPVEMLSNNPNVSFVRFLQSDKVTEPQVALLQINAMSNLNAELNSNLKRGHRMDLKKPFPEDILLVAALTKQGFRRAMLLDYIEKSSVYLVYEVDEGRISVTNEVYCVPSELLGHPMRVFAITLEKGSKISLHEVLSKHITDLKIKIAEKSHDMNEKKVESVQASLKADNQFICNVLASSFLGLVGQFGQKYWLDPIDNDQFVFISRVIDYKELCISSVQCKQYEDWFKLLENKCLPFKQSTDIHIDDIVLVVNASHNNYRAMVTGIDNNKIAVRNLDTGSMHSVSADELRKPCRFVESLPVSLRRVKIVTICGIPSSAVPPKTVALNILMKLNAEKMELQVKFKDTEENTVDLLDFTANPPSLMARMLPALFLPVSVEHSPAISSSFVQEDYTAVTEFPAQPPSAAKSSNNNNQHKKRHYFTELERYLVPIGKNMQVLVLNDTDLHKLGYITACYFESEQIVKDLEKFLKVVGEIGKTDDTLQPGYLPEVGELCLTLYADDNSWYRGVCQEVFDGEAHMLYIDFGNTETVPIKNIKPISSKVLSGVYATKCFIDGFDKNVNFLPLEEYLTKNKTLLCDVLNGAEPDTRLLQISSLEKILSGEKI